MKPPECVRENLSCVTHNSIWFTGNRKCENQKNPLLRDYDPVAEIEAREPATHLLCDMRDFDLVSHLAWIEAGWTLPKPWKAEDSERMEEANRQEIREMLARWKAHGIDAT